MFRRIAILLSGTSIRANIPSLNLNFLSGTLDSRVTFTRGSNATIIDRTGRITYAPNNLALRSEEFNDVGWGKAAVTTTVNATTAPNGTTTAEKIIPSVASSEHYVRQIIAVPAGSQVSASIYVKAAEYRSIRLRCLDNANPSNGFLGSLDTSTGTTVGGVVGAGTFRGVSATNVGDGWWRIGITGTGGPTAASIIFDAFVLPGDQNSVATFSGNGTSGLFIWGAQFELVTYQTQPSAYNQTAASAYYGPRFDFDPVTLAPDGLLIEDQRTNLATHSEQFDNGAWFKDHTTLTVNSAEAPDGTTTAEKAIPNNGGDLTAITHGVVRQNIPHTAGATLTFSVFAKQAEFNRIELYFSEGTGTTNFARVRYSLVDGSIVTAPTVGGTFTNASSTSTPFGNGWYRFTLTFTTAGVSATGSARIAIRDSVATVGNGTSGILIWGAQVEAASFATSYIPTIASTVTRSADNASMTGTNFSSWYNQKEGTFVASYINPIVGSNRFPSVYAARIQANNTSQNSNEFFVSTASAQNLVRLNGVDQASITMGGAYTPGIPRTVATAYQTNNFAAAFNGILSGTDSSGAVPVLDMLNIGYNTPTSDLINSHIRSLVYYPQRIPNLQLQTLSTLLNLDFLSGTLDSRITFSRVSNATLIDSTGRLTYAPNNLVLRSEEFDNAAWTKSNGSVTANATTSPDGTTTADKLVENTAVTTGHFTFVSFSVTAGQFYILSVYAKAAERTFLQLIATGVGPAGANLIAGFDLTAGTAGTPSATVTSTITPAGGGWYRCSIAVPVVTTVSGSLQIRLSLNNTSSPSSYTGDGTSGIFVWGAQLEQVTYQTVPSTYVPTTTAAYYGPRFDYNPITQAPLGLLLEEQRTNSIRNSSMVGAVAGAPGTSPTNYARTGSGSPVNGISIHFVGTGTEDGIPYIDARVFGTNTAAGTQYVDITYDIVNITAAQNQTWTQSAYYRLISGNFTGFTSATNLLYGTPGFNDNASVSITNITNAPLIRQRVVSTRTFTDAGTTGASPRAGFTVAQNATVDVTVRIGLPQLEQGAFATSAIPTATATVIRAADVAVMTGTNFSNWYNQSEGTMVASVDTVTSTGSNVISFQDGAASSNNRHQMTINTAFTATVVGGVVQSNIGTNANLSPTLAYAYKTNDFAACANGAAVSVDTSGTVPTTLAYATLGKFDFGAAASLNGHIRTLTYYQQRIDNTQLPGLTV